MAAMSGVGCPLLRASFLQTIKMRGPLTAAMTVRLESQQTALPNSQPQNPVNNPKPKQSRFKVAFGDEVENMTDLKTTLKLMNVRALNKEVAMKMVNHMGQLVRQGQHSELTGEQLSRLLNDKKFDQLSLVLHEKVEEIMLDDLLKSVECLLQMTKEDIFLTKSIETQLIWLLKTMSIGNIVKVLTLHKDHQETTLRREVWDQAIDAVQSRLLEIEKSQDLISLMYLVGDNHPELLSKLEDRAIQLCDSMKHKDMSKLIFLLSKRKRSNKPLMSKLISTLNNGELGLSAPQAKNLLFSCANLQIYHKGLIQKATDIVKANTDNIQNLNVATRILQYLSALRWRDEELLNTLCDVVVRNRDISTYHDLHAVFLTCANLDFMPESLSCRLGQVIDRLGLENCHSKQWLEIVWSCAVLRCLNPEMVSTLNDEKFVSNIRANESKTGIVNIKLRNITSAALQEISGYQGPSLDQSIIKIPVRQNRPLLTSVIKAMSLLAPQEKYLEFDVSHPSGFSIDIELTVNDKGKPVPKDSKSDSNCHRLAVKVLDFPDMILNTSTPIGVHAMAMRHLAYHGYKVIQVPHTEFQKLMTEVQRVQYIEKRIKSAIDID